LLRGKGRVIAVPPRSSFKLIIESKIVNDSQFPLPIEKGAEINVEIDDEKIILRRVSQI
jgi:LEA14-like dessication related protein